jgi:hypothetical protein
MEAYLPFNAFVFLWILGMLASVSLFTSNDKEGE